jgi:hypothetical protein
MSLCACHLHNGCLSQQLQRSVSAFILSRLFSRLMRAIAIGKKMIKLGLKRTTLIHRMKKLGINRPLRVSRMDMPGSVTVETESMAMA